MPITMKMNLSLSFGLALFAGAATAFAQSGGPYDLSWSTIDGGGGTSSGGEYSISGTIGQPDAGALSGGAYELVGGFWGVVQTPGAPLLKIRLAGSNVILSWPYPSTGWHLQMNSAVPGNDIAWLNGGPAPAQVGSDWEVTVPGPIGDKFFRLRRP